MLPLLKFSPVLLPKPWGGDLLWRALGKGAASDDRMGESWELSDRPEAPTPVAEGPLAGKTITELLTGNAPDLMGASFAGSPQPQSFPLLYKFIGAREKLSVQVHPGAGSPLGEAKTECWYVVDAAPGAELIVGVRPEGRDRAETIRLLTSPACEQVLQRLPARKGDLFFIPAGTVHAITEGLLLYELQQNSDTTFRLYDWGRTDAQGNPRALHVTEAAAVADTQAREGYCIPPARVTQATHTEDYLVACPYFVLVKWSGFKGPVRLETRGRFRVVTVLSGELTMRPFSGAMVRLGMGETALVPACHASVEVEASAEAEVLVSFVPESADAEQEVRGPLRSAGHAPAVIDALFGPEGVGG